MAAAPATTGNTTFPSYLNSLVSAINGLAPTYLAIHPATTPAATTPATAAPLTVGTAAPVPASAAPAQSNTAKYLGIGAAFLAVVGIAAIAFKK